MIRTLRATDLLRILLGNSGIGPDWAQTWEKVGLHMGHLGPTTVARELVRRRGMECCSVWAEGARLLALASVRERSGPRAWEVRCLHLSPGAVEEGVELLERLCMAVERWGGERMFLRMLTSSPVVGIARQAGFSPYVQETLYRREDAPSFDLLSSDSLRPYLPADDSALFRLYNACAPARVRSAYALTFEEWWDAQEPVGGEEHHLAYEVQGCLRGWLRVASGSRSPNRIEGMLHPDEEARVWEELLAWGVQQGRPRAPFLALVPHYQTTLATVLERKGFIPSGEYHVMVKSIAVRVKESLLAPAGA